MCKALYPIPRMVGLVKIRYGNRTQNLVFDNQCVERQCPRVTDMRTMGQSDGSAGENICHQGLNLNYILGPT